MLQTKVAQEIKMHILCSIMFFENRSVYEIIWYMHFVSWITKATNIHPEYVILIAFPL